jgi:hypothetical protein
LIPSNVGAMWDAGQPMDEFAPAIQALEPK